MSLTSSEGNRTKHVHALVMLAFVGPRPAHMEVAHLNGDRSDNRLGNLKYVSHVENESHKVAHGTSSTGEGNSNARLQGWQVAEIKYLAAKSVPQGKIASLFDISHKHVNDILHGRSWSHTPARTDLDVAERALRAVVEVHHRVTQDLPTFSGMRSYTYCGHCFQTTGDMRDNPWPCETYRAITTAFEAGEES